jgi:hypothetical protein
MHKTMTAFAAAGALALATVAFSPAAQAGCGVGCAVGAGIGGFAAGAIVGGAIANSAPPPPPAAYYGGPPPAYVNGQFYRHAVACPGGYWAERPWQDGYGRLHPTMWFCP